MLADGALLTTLPQKDTSIIIHHQFQLQDYLNANVQLAAATTLRRMLCLGRLVAGKHGKCAVNYGDWRGRGFYCPDHPIPVMGKPKLQKRYCTLGRFACEIWTSTLRWIDDCVCTSVCVGKKRLFSSLMLQTEWDITSYCC